jgi:6-phosphogluconolactonase (cycloisomerase 2 family)
MTLLVALWMAGCGSTGTGLTPGPTPPANSEFLFVPIADSNTVVTLVIGSDGSLAATPTPLLATGVEPVWAAVDPTNHFVYVTNLGSNSVSAFTFNGTSGILGGVGQFTAGTAPGAVAVDPAGKFVYVANDTSNNVSGFTINSGGSLTAVPGSPFAAGTTPQQGIAVSGRFVYVSNLASNDVSAYTFDATTGALTPIAGSPFTLAPAGTAPESLTMDPAGKFLFVANMNSDNISAFTVNADGSLTPVAGSPFAAGHSPQYLVTDRTGSFLYVVNVNDNAVTTYTIGAAGALSPTANVLTGLGPEGLTVDASNKFLYVANCGDGTLSVYSINGSTLMALGNVFIGGCPQAVAATH